MIGHLTGRLEECTPGQVLIDIGGVGYAVRVSLRTFYAFSGDTGSTVSLHVHTHVREDALILYGFAEQEERAHFEQLIGISGVGPKMALAILSGIGGDELREAVLRQDKTRFQKIPGVGKKTAERVLLELRDKIDAIDPVVASSVAADSGAAAGSAGSPHHDAVSALVNLGYSRDHADRMVLGSIENLGYDASLEAVLRRALGGKVQR